MLYRRALGPSFDALPPGLQAFHAGDRTQAFDGEVEVLHGPAIARPFVRVAGFPTRSGWMRLGLTIRRDGESEIWERSFGGHVTRSRQWLAEPGLIAERIGPATVLMRPVVEGAALRLPVVGLRGFGLPLPSWLMAEGGGVERVDPDGALHFDVGATARLIGPLIRYRGILRPLA